MRLFTVGVLAFVALAGAAGPIQAQLPGLAGAASALKATDDFRKGAEALERAAKSFEATAKVIEGAAKGFGADLVKASENVAHVGKDFDPLGVKMAITTLAEQNKQLAQLVEQQRQTTAALKGQLEEAAKIAGVGQPGRVACYKSGDGKPGVYVKAVDRWYDFGTDDIVTEWEDATNPIHSREYYLLKHPSREKYIRLYLKPGKAFVSGSKDDKGNEQYQIDWRK